mgnify:CR=1 FL=1
MSHTHPHTLRAGRTAWPTRRLGCVCEAHVPFLQDMKRSLFIFAKLNPGLRYVQGMNELYAPIYWLFKTGEPHEAPGNCDGHTAGHSSFDICLICP